MRSGLAFSVGLHAAILAVALVGVPWIKPKRLEIAEPIPVDLVDASQLPGAPKAAETPVRQPRPVREPPKPETQPPPPPTAAPAQPTPEPPKLPQPPQLAMNMPPPREAKPVERPPEPVAQPKPPEPKPEVKPEPRPEPTPVSVPKPPPEVPKPPELPPPAARPKPVRVPPPKLDPPKAEPAKPEPAKREEPKPREPQPDFQSVLKNLAKVEPQARTEEPPTKQPSKPSPPQPQSLSDRQADKLTAGEEDALRNQIAGCWNFNPGSRGIENMTAEIRVAINPDGTVRDAQIIDASRLNSDSFYRSFAESAVRAVKNPKCSPLALSRERIAQHPVITFNFNPKDMF